MISSFNICKHSYIFIIAERLAIGRLLRLKKSGNFILSSDRHPVKCQTLNYRHRLVRHLQGGPAKVRPTYIFDGNI